LKDLVLLRLLVLLILLLVPYLKLLALKWENEKVDFVVGGFWRFLFLFYLTESLRGRSIYNGELILPLSVATRSAPVSSSLLFLPLTFDTLFV